MKLALTSCEVKEAKADVEKNSGSLVPGDQCNAFITSLP